MTKPSPAGHSAGEESATKPRPVLSTPKGSSPEHSCARSDFDRVYLENFDFACRSLCLLGVRADALEDAAQDVFGVVLRQLPDFDGTSPAKTWIFSIVRGVAANYRRSSRRKQAPLQPLSELMPTDAPSPEAYAEASQASARIQAFCDGLDESRRAVFVLALVEEVPAKEIAPALGLPLFTVYSRMRSLRAALQRFLERHEVAP
jgi:RNA polymerase sigma-70 factor (ECF subfamily)